MDEMTEDKFIELTQAATDAKRKTICLFEDADGNWRGTIVVNGKPVFVRDVGPETVLQLLLTHSGK